MKQEGPGWGNDGGEDDEQVGQAEDRQQVVENVLHLSEWYNHKYMQYLTFKKVGASWQLVAGGRGQNRRRLENAKTNPNSKQKPNDIGDIFWLPAVLKYL